MFSVKRNIRFADAKLFTFINILLQQCDVNKLLLYKIFLPVLASNFLCIYPLILTYFITQAWAVQKHNITYPPIKQAQIQNGRPWESTCVFGIMALIHSHPVRMMEGWLYPLVKQNIERGI